MSSAPVSPPRWNELTALFGGTFDPPHLGHRAAVRGLFADPGVRRVVILPSATPPHKGVTTSAEHRIALARLGFAARPNDESLPLSVASSIEIDTRETLRTGPSYTYDTLQEFRRQVAGIAFVIGTDQLRDLPTWHRFPEVLELAHWIVLDRKQSAAGESLQQLEGSSHLRASGSQLWRVRNTDKFLRLVPTEAPALSSSFIRETIARTGQPPEDAVLPEVFSYLKQFRLYGTQ